MVLGPVKPTSLAVNVAENPWLQSWPMNIRLRLPKSGNTLERQAPIGSWGKSRRAVCDAWIDDPFGSPTRMPLDVENLFLHGVEGPRKWLVQPKLTMPKVLGTKVRGAVVFVIFILIFIPQTFSAGFISS